MTVQEEADTFIHELTRREDDRGFMAALRHLSSDARRMRGYQALAKAGGAYAIGNPVAETVAALFANHHEKQARDTGFGASCRQIANRAGEDAFDAHFRRLLACRTREDACTVVFRIGRLARSKGIHLDYTRLYTDLSRWEYGNTRIDWARQYYGAPAYALEEPEAPAADA